MPGQLPGAGGTMSSSPYQLRNSTKRRSELGAKAHHLRHHPTFTEHLLWSALRGSQLGVAFRRQVVIASFIADFVCPSRRLVVEVDGGVHAARALLDAQRDAALERAGYRVLRVPAALVVSNLPVAVALVRAAL
jgi:very-short-patch-repair endonuclease